MFGNRRLNYKNIPLIDLHMPKYADVALPKIFLEAFQKTYKLVKCNFIKVASYGQLAELEKKKKGLCLEYRSLPGKVFILPNKSMNHKGTYCITRGNDVPQFLKLHTRNKR